LKDTLGVDQEVMVGSTRKDHEVTEEGVVDLEVEIDIIVADQEVAKLRQGNAHL